MFGSLISRPVTLNQPAAVWSAADSPVGNAYTDSTSRVERQFTDGVSSEAPSPLAGARSDHFFTRASIAGLTQYVTKSPRVPMSLVSRFSPEPISHFHSHSLAFALHVGALDLSPS